MTRTMMTPERCCSQGYGVFLFLWQFLIPLVVFVVAYWKILGVIRRQAKVATDRHCVKVAPKEPVAGTSGQTTKPADDDKIESDKRVEKGVMTAGFEGHRQVKGQNELKNLSQAQINVVRTMIYITVCFTLCWMPMYTYIMYKRMTVKQPFCR